VTVLQMSLFRLSADHLLYPSTLVGFLSACLIATTRASVCHCRLQDPLAIIGVTAIFLPFVLLGIAIATGLVDISVYR